MSVRVSIGSAIVIALSDTEQPYGASAVYPDVTDADWSAYRDLLSGDGQLLLNFGCYLVRADGRTILVDTGWGPTYNGRLLHELADARVSLNEIDSVIFTHLHGDHIGWNIVRDGDTLRPRFPNARYLAPEADWQYYAALPEPPLLFREQVLPLESLGVIDRIAGERTLSPSVTTVPTPGHTPGHLSLAISSAGEHGCILGDVAIWPVEAQETDWANAFDWDSALARRTRHAVLDRLERDHALVAASHFPKPGLGHFIRRDGRRAWQPLATSV